MNNFSYSIPTIIHFGKNQLHHLKEIKEQASKVLLVYGGGSIKKSGLYESVVKELKEAGIEFTECCGIEPNPRIESVRNGAKICRKNNINAVLAVGGGSVIDAAKIIAAGAVYQGDPWELVLDGSKIKSALPLYSVLTLSATGSEMDKFAVISDLSKNEKWGTASDCITPVMSILDPQNTFSVSKKQTAAGTADMMSHTFENYFTNVKGAYLQSALCEAVLKTCIKYGPVAVENPSDYEARANLMWAGSLAINGLLSYGAEVKWCVHPMEHELSAFYDITHGEGLAILTPVWMKYVVNKDRSKVGDMAKYGRNVWNLSGSDEEVCSAAIEKTRTFFIHSMKMPSSLREVGITDKTHFKEMAKKAANGCMGSYVPLSEDDIYSIYEEAL